MNTGLIIGLLAIASSLTGQVRIPEGYEIVWITEDPEFYDAGPRLNNCGQIAWDKRMGNSWADAEIFLYDNGFTTRLTNNADRDVIPAINDSGLVGWSRGPGRSRASQLFLYEKGEEYRFRDNPEGLTDLEINRHGHIAWTESTGQGCGQVDARVMYFDGQDIQQLTAGVTSDQSLFVNNLDDIVWTRYDFCADPWESDILYYSDGRIQQLTSGELEPTGPSINDRGQITWRFKDENLDRWIVLWENGESRVIIDGGEGPRINNLGHIFFLRWHRDSRTWQVYLSRDGETFTLSDDPFWNTDGSINDDGEVAWQAGGFPNNDVKYMRRIRTGDSEFDGDIDIDDLAKLVDCMTGPMWVERVNPGPEESLCECRFLDINHDGSVDLRDYTIFQVNYAK